MRANTRIFMILLFTLFSYAGISQTYYLDQDFNAGAGFNDETTIIKLQSDGKLVVAGSFTSYNGTTRNRIARVNADGTLDDTFDAGTTFDGETIYDVAIDGTSGTIYVASSLADMVTKLDSDGTSDGTYSFDDTDYDGPINALAIDGNGKLLAGQGPGTSGITARIARFNDDGSLDNTFTHADFIGKFPNDNSLSSSTSVNDIFVDGDGKILVAGNFTSFGAVAEGFIRLNVDGSIDDTFDLNYLQEVINSEKFAIGQQTDGKYLVSGLGTETSGGTTVERFNADGTADDANFSALSACCGFLKKTNKIIETDSGILLGGQSYGLLIKNSEDGTDTEIQAGDGHLSQVQFETLEIRDFVVDSEGGIISVGNSDYYNGTSIGFISRIETCESISLDMDLSANSYGCENEDKDISVSATGTNLTYQWQIQDSFNYGDTFTDLADDASYSGTSTATLSILNATSALNNNRYRCIVSDGNCSVVTSYTRLTIYSGQTITTQPTDQTGCIGESASFSMVVDGSPQDIQWQVDSLDGNGFQDMDGKTGSFLGISEVVESADGYMFRAILSTCNNPITSDEVTLSVVDKPEITSTPPNVFVCQSGDATFTVEATGNNLQYQWQAYQGSNNYTDLSDGGVYSGTNTATLSITGADNTLNEILESNSERDIAYYRLEVSNGGCTVSTGLVRFILLKNSPQVTSQPEDFSACYNPSSSGISGSFSVDADNAGTFQWQVDIGDGNGFVDMEEDSIFTRINSSRLEFEGVTDSLSGFRFRCVLGPCGPVTSGTATLIIDKEPEVELDNFEFRVCEGSDYSIEAISSESNVAYQWEVKPVGFGFRPIDANDTRYTGVNSSILTVLNVDTDLNDYEYRCKVVTTNQLCEDISNFGRLDVIRDINFSGGFEEVVELCENGINQELRSNGIRNFIRNFHTYQWQVAFKNSDIFIDLEEDDTYSNVRSTNFEGNSNAILQIDTARITLDSTRYRLVIEGCETDFISDTVLLTINQSPRITNSSVNQIVCLGEEDEVSFGVSASGDELEYLWQYADSPDGTFNSFGEFSDRNDTLTLEVNSSNAENFSGTYWRAIVRNGSTCQQTDTTGAAQLVINQVTILGSPYTPSAFTSTYLCEGDETYVSIEAEGEGLTYQWQVDYGDGFENIIADDTLYAGENLDTLRIPFATYEMVGARYRCVVGGNCESKTSDSQRLLMENETVPEIFEVFSNNAVEVILQVGGVSSPIAWEWYNEEDELISTNSEVAVSQNGIYYVVVTEFTGCKFTSEPYELNSTLLGLGVDPSLEVYPVPATDYLMISSEKGQKIEKIEIVSMTGKVLKSINPINNKIDVSSIKQGMYFVKIHTKDNVVIQRFIKQ